MASPNPTAAAVLEKLAAAGFDADLEPSAQEFARVLMGSRTVVVNEIARAIVCATAWLAVQWLCQRHPSAEAQARAVEWSCHVRAAILAHAAATPPPSPLRQ